MTDMYARRTTMRGSRSLVVVASVVSIAWGSTSCGGSVRAPDGADSPAAKKLLGEPSDFALVVNVDRIRNDSVYWPLAAGTAKDSDLEKIFGKISTIDLVGSFDGPKVKQASLVITVRGAPDLGEL